MLHCVQRSETCGRSQYKLQAGVHTHTHTYSDKEIHTCAVNWLTRESGKRLFWMNHNSHVVYLFKQHALLMQRLSPSMAALIHFSCIYPPANIKTQEFLFDIDSFFFSRCHLLMNLAQLLPFSMLIQSLIGHNCRLWTSISGSAFFGKTPMCSTCSSWYTSVWGFAFYLHCVPLECISYSACHFPFIVSPPGVAASGFEVHLCASTVLLSDKPDSAAVKSLSASVLPVKRAIRD